MQEQKQKYYKIFNYTKDAEGNEVISCRYTIFSLTEQNILRNSDGTINLKPLEECRNGFHFCKTAHNCTVHYYINKDNLNKLMLAEIEPKDVLETTKKSDKFVCREFKIIKTYKGDEILEVLLKERLDFAIEIYDKLKKAIPSLRLAGGLSHELLRLKRRESYADSLRLHDLDFEYSKDETFIGLTDEFLTENKITLVSGFETKETHKYTFGELEEEKVTLAIDSRLVPDDELDEYSDDVSKREIANGNTKKLKIKPDNVDGFVIDLFLETKHDRSNINAKYGNIDVEVSNPWVAVEYKMKYLKTGSKEVRTKHLNDLLQILPNLVNSKY